MTNSRKHEPALDGVRGLAILLVLITHCSGLFNETPLTRWFLPAIGFGWSGVDLFFVLSGYLITGILLRTKTASNRATSFYARRFLRIFPIYYLCLIVILLVAPYWHWLRTLLPYYSIGDRIAYFAYLQNWLPLVHSAKGVPANILGHFWSLAVEEQFYIVWPLLVWKLSEKHLFRLCLYGSVASFALSSILVSRFGPQWWTDIITPTRGMGLLVGSALAVALFRNGRLSGRVLLAMAAAGAGVIALISFADPNEFMNTSSGPYMYTIAIPGLALLFGALVGASQHQIPMLTPALNAGWLKSFGKYSYGIYVYHIPLFAIVNTRLYQKFGIALPLPAKYGLLLGVALIGMAYGVAWLSYNLFEKRFLNLKRRFDPDYQRAKTAEIPARTVAASSVG